MWHTAMAAYSAIYKGHHLYTDIVDVHRQLGLTVQRGTAVAFANLVSIMTSTEVYTMLWSGQKGHINILHSCQATIGTLMYFQDVRPKGRH